MYTATSTNVTWLYPSNVGGADDLLPGLAAERRAVDALRALPDAYAVFHSVH